MIDGNKADLGSVCRNNQELSCDDRMKQDLISTALTIGANPMEGMTGDKALQNYLTKLERLLTDHEGNLTNSLQEALIMLDDEGRIVRWNRAAENIFGYQYKEVYGLKLHDFLIPTELKKRAEESFQLFQSTGTGRYINKMTEVHARKKDGSNFIAEISISSISLMGKTHAIGIVRDITERRKAQKKLLDAMDAAQAANKAKSQFLANISHEIRTPMNGIIGFLDLLSKTSLNSQQLEYLREIQTSSEALLGLINDLLDFSKIEANKMELEHIEFNVIKLIEDEVSSFSLRAYAKGIELHAKIDDRIPLRVKGDPGKLKQIMENLIGNAVKFTHKGKVIVTAEAYSTNKDHIDILFCIEDTGIGIKESEKGKLFDPFTQVDASTTRKFGGTGLGLSICEKLVEMMSGKITVQSEFGKGSAFSFAVCFKKVQEDNDQTEIIKEGELKGLRVLVADPSSTNREIVRYYLEGAGGIVYEAENAGQSLKLLIDTAQSGSPVNVVLLNKDFPDRKGIDLAAEINSNYQLQSVAINLFTSYAEPEEQNNQSAKNISGWIYKPVFRNELINSILISLGKSGRIFDTDVDKPMDTGKQKDETVFDDNIKKNARFLLAEDNITNQRLVATILRNAGFSYDIAQNGREAIEAVDKKHYSLVFMDCQMPELDGYEATRQIRQKEAGKKHLAIVAMTANVMKSDIERCLNSGMDDYISKPFKANELLETAAKWLTKEFSEEEQLNGSQAVVLPDDNSSDGEAVDIRGILNQLSENQKIDLNDIYEIYNDFVDMLPESLQKLQRAVDSVDFKKIILESHTIKGASATLRLKDVSEIAAELEKQGKVEDITKCRYNMERLSEYCKEHIKNISL